MNSEEFKAKYGKKTMSDEKGPLPILGGTIGEWEGKTTISLWAREGFKDAIKEAIKEVMDGK